VHKPFPWAKFVVLVYEQSTVLSISQYICTSM
jgi:hypothetical protein